LSQAQALLSMSPSNAFFFGFLWIIVRHESRTRFPATKNQSIRFDEEEFGDG